MCVFGQESSIVPFCNTKNSSNILNWNFLTNLTISNKLSIINEW